MELSSELACGVARDIYSIVGYAPPHIVGSYRIRNRTPDQTRPIKVEVKHPTDVNVLLRSANQ